MNNEKKLPENVNYPLIYDELINGDFYATEYEDQGIYIFKNGYNLWLREGDSFPVTENNGNFTPENGFNKFRYATTAEVNRLVATTDQKQPRLKVGDKIPEYFEKELPVWEPENGEEVEVSDCGLNWIKRLFVGMNPIKENNGLIYFAANEESGHIMSAYKHCRQIKPKIIKTHSQIAEILGCDPEQLQIIKD